MTGRECDALARDIITRYGYGEYFGHSTGHGAFMKLLDRELRRRGYKGKRMINPRNGQLYVYEKKT